MPILKLRWFLFLFISFPSFAQLSEGDIMFVGINTDADDGIAIVALAEIPASSTIYFSDNEWNGSAIGGGGAFNDAAENTLTWTTPGSALSVGTVITFNDIDSELNPDYGVSSGSISGSLALENDNEVVYAFAGSDASTPTTFLSAISNSGFSVANGQLTNTGLAAGTNATEIVGGEDVATYASPLNCNTGAGDCGLLIATASNWVSQNDSGDQSDDATAPDFPADVPAITLEAINAGDLMFVGINGDGDDGFAIVALVDIPASSRFFISDNEWNGSAIGAGGAFNNLSEGEMTWNTGSATISAGTVITFNETRSEANGGYGATVGDISGVIDINVGTDVLYLFAGTKATTPSTFVSAFANNSFTLGGGQLANTGLVAGTHAIELTGGQDVAVYTGSTTCATTVSDCAAAIATPGNWTSQSDTGDQSNDAITPDFPVDVPGSFSGSALPIVLLDFWNETTEGGLATLRWVTVEEQDRDYFEILRSEDGLFYREVGKVREGNRVHHEMHYSYRDNDPVRRTTYFILKQVDLNGTAHVFNPIVVDPSTSGKANISLYPNPATNQFTLQSAEQQILGVKLINSAGKVCQRWAAKSTGEAYSLDVWPEGIYYIQVETTKGPYFEALSIR